jgi:N-sulfoglucosamine sulfohydrolase
MNRRTFLRRGAAAAFPAIIQARSGSAADRPNILWIIGDDLGCELGCYDFPNVRTPHMDRLANEGVRFSQFHTTAPVCSASRSAFNTGLYQTTIGAHNHRSHRKDGYTLPQGVRLITERLRERGYFTANVLEMAPGVRGTGKTDFNFKFPKPFDGTHWNQRSPGQPFYAQINFMAPHKGAAFKVARQQKELVDPNKIELPPYYPDHPVVRDEFANYLDAVNMLDAQVGVVLDLLAKDKLLDNTVICLFGDNGRCLLRGKQWLYDAGTHVPLIVRWPGVARPGVSRGEPSVALDLTATTLFAAGVEIPRYFHGRSLFGPQARPRDYIITARDRCDMTVDRIRSVRDRRYRYIRNFMPERPYTQHNEYIETSYPTLKVLKDLYALGKLDAAQALFMAPRKPDVEFYDTRDDPHQVKNLAQAPEQRARVAAFSKILDRWLVETDDKGRFPETQAEIDQNL